MEFLKVEYWEIDRNFWIARNVEFRFHSPQQDYSLLLSFPMHHSLKPNLNIVEKSFAGNKDAILNDAQIEIPL